MSRPLITRQNTPVETSLQVFCDASEIAHAAVVYMRNVYGDNTIEVSLVAAKTRVAPRRPTLTVPRLELNAAVLAARLAHKVDAALTSRVHKVDLWSDSTIVLSWMAQKTAVETKYVINRVTDILEALRELRCAKEEDSVTWRHVPTADNPSDDCTRGLRLHEMLPGQSCRYWHGADFLYQPRDTWPMGSSSQLYDISTLSSYNTWTAVTVEQETVFEFERYSLYLRVSRVAAFVLRFIHNTKNKESEKKHGCLQVCEYQNAEKLLSIESQKSSIKVAFGGMYEHGRGKNGWLKRLRPIVVEGLIRVGGRLNNAQSLAYTLRHPVILDGNERLAFLIVRDYHERHGHAGQQFVKNAVRDKYWITRLSWLTKRVKRQCIKCRKFDGKTLIPPMAALPSARVEPAMPFVKCGVDYFGPLLVRRGRSTEKTWGVIFTCFVTRAVHIELADSLAADSFINVYRRFVGRRGDVEEMWSDNGTNLVGGERELRSEIKKLKETGIDEKLTARASSGTLILLLQVILAVCGSG